MTSDKDTLIEMFDEFSKFAAEVMTYLQREKGYDINFGPETKAHRSRSNSFVGNSARITTIREFLKVIPEENISCFYPLLLKFLGGGMGSMYDFIFDSYFDNRQEEFQERWDSHLNKISNFVMDKSGLSLM